MLVIRSHGEVEKGHWPCGRGRRCIRGGTLEVEVCRVMHREWLIGKRHVESGGMSGGGALGAACWAPVRRGGPERVNAEQYGRQGSVLKMRGCKYTEYPSYWGQISNSEFLNIQTAAFRATQYQFQILRLNTYIQTGY
jgi:hypothetical protein